MKLLFDQNISYRLVTKIIDIFPDSIHIAALRLDTASDRAVWDYAKEHNYTIVTKDSDFNELTIYYGFLPHVIWLRIGNCSVDIIANLLIHHNQRIKDMILSNSTGIIEIIH